MPGPDEQEERYWEEEAGMRSRSPLGPGQVAAPDECNWAVAAQLSSLSGYLIPFFNIIAPLTIWLMKRDESAFIEDHAREALNFQISMTIYLAVAGLLIYVVVGFVLLPLLVLFNVIAVVMAAIRASHGEIQRYPASIRLIH